MGFRTFVVVLDPEQPVYIPGQVVKGYIRVIASEDVHCRKIMVIIKGRAEVSWSEGSGKNKRSYKAEELYFRHSVIVWRGSGSTMGPSDHKIPFSYTLPRNIPSSFLSNNGMVIYQVKAVADRPWHLDQTHKVFFSVNYMYDLNLDSFAVKPMIMQKEKTVCCLCCAQGPIVLNMVAHRTGYVPGESIVVNGEVVNHSGSTIEYTEIKLLQVITYTTSSNEKTVERTVQRKYHPQLISGGRDIWANESLHIPAVPASHLMHCNIIDINYVFVLTAKLGVFRKATVMAPIVIGSLPLRTTYSTFIPRSIPAPFGGNNTISTTNTSPRRPAPLYPPSAPSHPPSFPSYPCSAPSHPPSTPSHSPSFSSSPHSAPSHPPSFPSYSPSAPSHLPSTSSIPSSAPPHRPYGSDPPPYSEIFLPDEYRDVPPPSYASCMFGGRRTMVAMQDDEDGESDDGGFAPHYITYRPHI